VVGNRTLDFNTEGLVHIGLLPELIEDARRDAVDEARHRAAVPLGRGPPYIRMWERAEQRGAYRMTASAAVSELHDPTLTPEQALAERHHLRLAFIAALQRLPARQRAALLLAEVCEWTAPQIAETLGTTPAAVNSALQRARATLSADPPGRAPDPLDPTHTRLLDATPSSATTSTPCSPCSTTTSPSACPRISSGCAATPTSAAGCSAAAPPAGAPASSRSTSTAPAASVNTNPPLTAAPTLGP
jgi:RNA polymerase sigma factor (sigma-70 family)